VPTRFVERRGKGNPQHAVPRRPHAAEDSGSLVDRLEQFIGAVDRLARAQKQNAALANAKVQQGENPSLQVGLQIDQEVAASADVQPRKRRILNDILRREHNQLAQLALDAINGIVPVEVTL
jgi:hypothetical protein